MFHTIVEINLRYMSIVVFINKLVSINRFAGSKLSTDTKTPKCIYKISKNLESKNLVKYSAYAECEIIHCVNCEILRPSVAM